jgi:hypothetical protein
MDCGMSRPRGGPRAGRRQCVRWLRGQKSEKAPKMKVVTNSSDVRKLPEKSCWAQREPPGRLAVTPGAWPALDERLPADAIRR